MFFYRITCWHYKGSKGKIKIINLIVKEFKISLQGLKFFKN